MIPTLPVYKLSPEHRADIVPVKISVSRPYLHLISTTVNLNSSFFWIRFFDDKLVSPQFQDLSEWCEAFTFIARLIAYLAVLALLIFVIVTILKYLAESDDDQATTEHFELPPPPTTETTPLCCSKWVPATYRTCGEGEDDDIETGSCSSSSSEELYDGKICVICYDEERNCFFVPCGHCATCYSCGER
ncbi:hypothetical protein CDL15_Pgr001702 [Punica granatum]|uniref:RING-type domain-containing protein n=1 Tax=Punica granatum TaxID=22663 RepID=A0A218XBG0_PUNGR|nr:hypothetical protein CDL15_Pgr001702 [Punica granatum]